MSMTISDADLIRSFQSGDHDVFAEIVSQYQDELVRHACRRVHDTAAAEDLVQDTFMRAYRAFDRLADDSQLRPWLHRILENRCIDESHRRRRELDKVQRVGTEAPLREQHGGPEAELGLDYDDATLVAALAALPETHREALWLRYVDGLDYAEIADGAEITEVNARARVSRARSAARRTLTGAASVPLFVFGLVRRPGSRQPATLADGPNAALQTGANSVVHAGAAANAGTAANAAVIATNAANVATSASTTASSFASALSPVIEIANHAAVAGQNAMPLLTKVAAGIGAVAVAFTAAPERPIDTLAPIAVEVAAPAPAAAQTELVVAAPDITATTTVVATTVVVTTTVVASTTAPATTAPPTTLAPATTALAPSNVVVPAVVVAEAPATTLAAIVVPSTTIAVVVTAAPTTIATTVAPPPPIVGGTLSGSPSVTPSGPRLDVNGGIDLTVAGSTTSGSINGRIGVAEPDPSGSRRIDATLTLSLGTGTIDIRLAGHGTSTEAPVAGVVPNSLTMSGVYRASGATGQLATSGSFSASVANGALSIRFSP